MNREQHGQVLRGPLGKRHSAMDFIPDRALYAAVMFARKMIREGAPAALAIYRAAKYYKAYKGDVAHFTGQAGGTHAHRRKQ